MKFISSKLLQKARRKQYGKYRIVLEVTDIDIEILEDLATCYCTREAKSECEFKDEYMQWIKKAYRQFHKLWVKYDDECAYNKNVFTY